MTKQRQNNKLSPIITVGITALGAIGMTLLNYYTKAKMGMLRHVVYLNGKWNRNYDIDLLTKGLLVLIIVNTVIALYKLYRGRNGKRNDSRITSVTILIASAISLYYALTYNTTIHRAYYLNLLVIGLVSVIYLVISLITKKIRI